MKKTKTIGILAGMGLRSTSPFVDLVIDECQKQYGAKYDEDFPHIIIYSLPTPFYVDKQIDHKKMKKIVCQGLKKLEKTGVDFIAMPCNFVHVYYDELKKCIKIPLLNIVDETLKKVDKQKSGKVTVFATSSTIKSEVYQKKITKLELECVLKQEWQKIVDELIKGVKLGVEKKELEKKWLNLVDSVKKARVEAVIIACTDLNPIVKKAEGIQFIDSSQSLAKAVVERYLN